jgi:hypothetical protein
MSNAEPSQTVIPPNDNRDADFTRPVLVSERSFAAFERDLEHPPAATPALRALFGKK